MFAPGGVVFDDWPVASAKATAFGSKISSAAYNNLLRWSAKLFHVKATQLHTLMIDEGGSSNTIFTDRETRAPYLPPVMILQRQLNDDIPSTQLSSLKLGEDFNTRRSEVSEELNSKRLLSEC